MAMPAASGSISLGAIQTEFGGANPIAINEYYKGGTYVLNTDTTGNIPASGQIKFSDFWSTAKVLKTTTRFYPSATGSTVLGWSNPTRSYGLDGSTATGSSTTTLTRQLTLMGYNMSSIPSGATILTSTIYWAGIANDYGAWDVFPTFQASFFNSTSGSIGILSSNGDVGGGVFTSSLGVSVSRAQLTGAWVALSVSPGQAVSPTNAAYTGYVDCAFFEITYL